MAGKLAVEYTLTGQVYMSKKYFLQSAGTVYGPLEAERILLLIEQGNLNLTDKISSDKINWDILQKVLPDLKFPGISPALDNKPAPPDDKVVIDEQTAGGNTPADMADPPLDRSFLRILSNTIGAFANGSTNWQKLSQKGNAAIAISSTIALISSLLLSAFGSMLFAGYCRLPEMEFYLRTMLWLLCCGSLFFAFGIILRLVDNLGDPRILHESMLTATLAMLSFSVMQILLHGVLFVLLPSCSWMLTATAASGVAGLFLLNTTLILRISLLNSTRFGAGWSTFWAFAGSWVSFVIYLFIVVPIYK